MTLRTTRILHFLVKGGMVISLVFIFFSPGKFRPWWELCLFLFLLSGSYLDYNLWRCPWCGFHLGPMKKIPSQCKNCHQPIHGKIRIYPKENRKIQKEWMEQKKPSDKKEDL